jgi:Asp-tRNA(Asn)/Glu-tRNA(Gln) amidotransferase C subunit
VKGLDSQREAYLVRYDYTRLDGLRGYGAGMPAPGLWNRSWQARTSGKTAQEFVLGVILDVVGRAREDDELIPTATVQAAVEQTLMLADLRDRAWPGRTDILDAMLSCLVRDEFGFTGPLAAALTDTFGGNELGQIPDNVASPPLVTEARAKAQGLRFSVDTSQPKQVSLDTARKPGHVRRREFLALMRFIGSGFATQISGADVVRGRDLGLLFEEWEYAWTPMVESRLIDLSATGPTLDTAVAATLARRLAELGVDPQQQAQGAHPVQSPQPGNSRSAPRPTAGGSTLPHAQAAKTPQPAQIAGLICEIAAFGGHSYLDRVLERLAHVMSEEPHVSELVTTLHTLADLVENQGRLDLSNHVDQVQAIIVQGFETLRYQLPTAVRVEGEDREQLVTTLMSIRDLLHRGATPDDATENLRVTLGRLREDTRTPQRIVGALVGLAYVDGDLSHTEAIARVAIAFSPVADPESLTEFLLGLMRVAPDMVLHSPELLEAVDGQLARFDDQAFRAVLPDLRQAFGSLKPFETHTLAGNVARLHNAQVGQIDVRLNAAPQDIAYGAAIEKLLASSLERDGLGEWVR